MITRLATTGLAAVALALGGSAVARADVSTQQLPPAACNAGTMNAHESVPETTGNGMPIFAHGAIPGTGNVTPCGHGG